MTLQRCLHDGLVKYRAQKSWFCHDTDTEPASNETTKPHGHGVARVRIHDRSDPSQRPELETDGAVMTYLKTVAGALAIMMASGMIADFDVSETDDNEIMVRVWPADDRPDTHLRLHVAALLARHVADGRVSVVRPDIAR